MKNTSVKKKGPIRHGAVIPTLLLILLVGLYFTFLFDHNLRSGLQYVGTHVNGAEVDIRAVHTSFLHAELEIDDIEVTDKTAPDRNSVQVGKVKFAMLWDALLRAKIAIDEAEILNVEALVPRKHAGYVLPPPPPSDGKPGELKKVEDEVLAQTKEKYNGNFLGDVAAVLGGGDTKSQLADLQGNLKSDAKIKELQKELDGKKAAWEQRLKALPQDKELKGYVDRIKALKFDLNNPGELAKSVGEAQKIVNEAKGKVQVIDQTQKDLQSDLNNYNQQYKDLEKLVQADIHDLQGRLKLPNIDAKEFSQQLFMTMLEKKLGGLAKYVELARHYMPTRKSAAADKVAQKEVLIPPKRGQGKTFHYPVTTGYPLFWLKHAELSSQANSGEYSGNLKGEIKNLTSDPVFLGKPTLVLFNGEFPKPNIFGLDCRITIDHTTDVAKESMDLKVARFPVHEQVLSSSPDVKLALSQARGASDTHAEFVNDELTMHLKSDFSEIKYDLEAKNPTVQEIIDNVLKGIPLVNVNADVKGSLQNLDIHINSNLGDELSKGFAKQLQAKIEQAKAGLKKLIDDKIGGDRSQLKGQLDQFGGLGKIMDGKKGEADKEVAAAQGQANPAKGGNQQKQLEEQGKKLLKGLGF